MSAPKHNQFAVKEETKDANVVLRVHPDEKNRWVRAANKQKQTLAAWIRGLLNGNS